MVEDKLNSCFINKGYKRIDSNAKNIYIYYCIKEQEYYIAAIFNLQQSNDISADQYNHILKQIMVKFRESSNEPHLVSLIMTNSPDKVKHLCENTLHRNHWIIDFSTYKLIIYENQESDFDGLKDVLEQLLDEECELCKQNASEGHKNLASDKSSKELNSPRTLQLTIINSIIIAINIIVYFISHYTRAFGGEDYIYRKSALSWYLITEYKEYYRLLTSMFMHADGSHIINNMVVLLFIGSNLERAVGKLKYIFIYFGTGIIAGIASISYNMWQEKGITTLSHTTFSIGASGAIFGTVGAFLFIVAINKGRLEQINLRQIILFVILSLYSGIANARIDQAAHIGGFIAGIFTAAILCHKTNKPRGYGKTQ